MKWLGIWTLGRMCEELGARDTLHDPTFDMFVV